MSKVQNYFENAKSQIDLVHTWKRFLQFWNFYEETHRNAMDKGVKIHELVEYPMGANNEEIILAKEIFAHRMVDIKFVNRMGGNFAVIDDKIMFVSATHSSEDLGKSPLLFSNFEVFVGIMQDYFQKTWQTVNKCSLRLLNLTKTLLEQN